MNKYLNLMKNESNKLGQYILNNKKLIIVILFFGILAYGFILCNFTIGVDTEGGIYFNGSPSKDWVSQGRFGIGILKKLFSTNQIIPFRNSFLAFALMIINNILLCYTLESKNKKNSNILNIIMSVLYITSPIFVHSVYFTTYNFEIQVGILLSIIACYASSKYVLDNVKSKILPMLSILIMSFVIGIYQSFIGFYFALICYKIIDYLLELKDQGKIVNFKEIIKIALNYIKIILLSVVLYYIIDKVFSVFIAKGSYLDGLIGWNKSDFKIVFLNVIKYIKEILLDSKIIGTNILLYTSIISVLLILYYSLFKKSLRIYVPLLIISIMASPFLLTIILGFGMPYRTQQTLILIAPLIFGILYKTVNNKYIRYIICIIVIFVGFNQSMYTNKLLYSDYARYQQDLDLTRQIANKINELGYVKSEDYKVICIGRSETNQTSNIIKQELIGYSIFEWDGGNPLRIMAFMGDSGYNYMQFNTDDVEKVKPFSINLPVWPNEGCIKLVDNTIIVKLSN